MIGKDDIESHVPLGRFSRPDDIVGTVLFLSSPAANLITGADIAIDGGQKLSSGLIKANL